MQADNSLDFNFHPCGQAKDEKELIQVSMTIAHADLGLEKVYLVYPGELSFPLRDGMETLGYARIPEFEFP